MGSFFQQLLLLVLLLASAVAAAADDGLKIGYYDKTCPNAEKIVRDLVNEHVPHAPSIAPALLRLHFHDCFVRGCDGSILIDSTSKNQAEKSSPPNLSIRGFSFIDTVKRALEAACPEVVSCADIVALVARDAVMAIGGPSWKVPTGRKDGIISSAAEAFANIPSPGFNFSTLKSTFASKGLDTNDLILLSGAHTIGVAHCPSVSPRLYNFSGRGDEDPSLDPEYAANLKKYKCKTPGDTTTFVEMDPGSSLTFDLGYYHQVLKRRGLFGSDAALTTDRAAKAAVAELADSPAGDFFAKFGMAMEKMNRIQVLTGSIGQIRKKCAVVNSG